MQTHTNPHVGDLRALKTPDMLLVGLTGNIAAGKSTAARLLVEHGATLIDADVLAREAVRTGSPGYDAIVERWGSAILQPDGALDRGALRRRVFDRPDELHELNAIVHPEVESKRAHLVAEALRRGDRVVVCDIPLLFENNLVEAFDRVILVDAPRPVRLERLVRDRGLRETEAMAMIAQQMPADLKRARADFVIDNDGTRQALARRVDEVWHALDDEMRARQSADS